MNTVVRIALIGCFGVVVGMLFSGGLNVRHIDDGINAVTVMVTAKAAPLEVGQLWYEQSENPFEDNSKVYRVDDLKDGYVLTSFWLNRPGAYVTQMSVPESIFRAGNVRLVTEKDNVVLQ